MGQYGNQPDFGTRAEQTVPAGFAQGDLITVTYGLSGGAGESIQQFTSRNLDVTTYNDGVIIPQATTESEWEAFGLASTGCWAYYNYDPANGSIYGKIYNGWAIDNNSGHVTICPDGFALPSYDPLFLNMTDTGYNPILGREMKSKGTIENGSGLWAFSDESSIGTDSFNFTGLPGGRISASGSKEEINMNGIFWSNSINEDGTLNNAFLTYNNSKLYTWNFSDKAEGFSIRLIPDANYVAPIKLNSAALYVGKGGDLIVTVVGNTEPTIFKDVPAGTFFPVIVDYIWERSNDSYTTASNIVALY
jgi:uncharacterized protein (TIGR02145 family)